MFGIKSKKRIKELEKQLQSMEMQCLACKAMNKTLLAENKQLEYHLGLYVHIDKLKSDLETLEAKLSKKKK